VNRTKQLPVEEGCKDNQKRPAIQLFEKEIQAQITNISVRRIWSMYQNGLN